LAVAVSTIVLKLLVHSRLGLASLGVCFDAGARGGVSIAASLSDVVALLLLTLDMFPSLMERKYLSALLPKQKKCRPHASPMRTRNRSQVRRVEVYGAIYARLSGSIQKADGHSPIRQRIEAFCRRLRTHAVPVNGHSRNRPDIIICD